MTTDAGSMPAGRTAVSTTAASAPAGTYSQAIVAAGLVFVSGQTPRGGLAMAAHVTVFLRDQAKAAEFDAIYRGFVGSAPPAQSDLTVGELEVNAILALAHPTRAR